MEAVLVAADESSHKAKKHRVSSAPLTAAAAQPPSSEAEDLSLTKGDGTGGDTAAEQRLSKIKWKKMAAQVLKEHSGTLKLSKLQQQLRFAAQVSDNHAALADALIQSRLSGSSQFLIKKKSVMLASAQ